MISFVMYTASCMHEDLPMAWDQFEPFAHSIQPNISSWCESLITYMLPLWPIRVWLISMILLVYVWYWYNFRGFNSSDKMITVLHRIRTRWINRAKIHTFCSSDFSTADLLFPLVFTLSLRLIPSPYYFYSSLLACCFIVFIPIPLRWIISTLPSLYRSSASYEGFQMTNDICL